MTYFGLSKFKEFADDNFILNENGRKCSKRVENTVGKGESVFNRLVLQTHKNQGLFGKGIIGKKNVHNHHFLLHLECFQMSAFSIILKHRIIW